MPCGSEGSVARDSAGHVAGGSGDRLRCSNEAGSEDACGFCLLPLVGISIRCSGSGEKFHSETLCMGVEEKVISVLLEDNGCCEFLL